MMKFRLATSTLLALALVPAVHAQQWTTPTPEELSMTSFPEVPGADAIILNQEETDDDDMHVQSHYMRIKILSEKGLKYADVEINYEKAVDSSGYTIGEFFGRTVQPDGSIVPFTGKGMDKVLEKDATNAYTRRAYALPAAKVGSILEYRYTIRRDDHWYAPSRWSMQGALYIRKEHFLWKPTDKELLTTSRGGRENISQRLTWAKSLPTGTDVIQHKLPTGRVSFEANATDVMPFDTEQYMPPIYSSRYHVYFYHTPYYNAKDYWDTEVKYWNSDTNKFTSNNSTVSTAAHDAIAGATTDEDKARKLYAYVMTFENTDYTRVRTTQEEKKEIKSAEDVLKRKHGSADQIAMTYVALARAAGLKADSMLVADRSRLILDVNWQDIHQLTDTIVVVNYGGQDHYLDPGSRYNPFGHLEWDHSISAGIRQDNKNPANQFTMTPGEPYKYSHISRVGDITVAEDGQMSGKLTLTFEGSRALNWRHVALKNDDTEMKDRLKKEIESLMPGGTEVTVDSIMNVDNGELPLRVQASVKGRIGNSMGSRVMLPSVLFENNSRPRFPHEKREQGVYFPFSEIQQDAVRYTLPASWTVESAPTGKTVQFEKVAAYTLNSQQKANTITLRRDYIMGDIYFENAKYAELRKFYNDFEALDHSTVIIKRTPTTASVAAPSSAQ
jgi:transglutaminase-like putative cysteine protease